MIYKLLINQTISTAPAFLSAVTDFRTDDEITAVMLSWAVGPGVNAAGTATPRAIELSFLSTPEADTHDTQGQIITVADGSVSGFFDSAQELPVSVDRNVQNLMVELPGGMSVAAGERLYLHWWADGGWTNGYHAYLAATIYTRTALGLSKTRQVKRR